MDMSWDVLGLSFLGLFHTLELQHGHAFGAWKPLGSQLCPHRKHNSSVMVIVSMTKVVA